MKAKGYPDAQVAIINPLAGDGNYKAAQVP